MTLNVTKFAAIKGKQSGDDYFTVICEMGLIPKLFLFFDTFLRLYKISRYLLQYIY